jgi:hypothetical protein
MSRTCYDQATLDRLRARADATRAARDTAHWRMTAAPGEETTRAYYVALDAYRRADQQYNAACRAVETYGLQTAFDTTDPTAPRQLALFG